MLKPRSRSRCMRKGPVLKIAAAARTMRDMESRSALEAREVFFREFVQVHDDPAFVDRLPLEHHCQRRFSRAAVVHRATETLQQFEQPARDRPGTSPSPPSDSARCVVSNRLLLLARLLRRGALTSPRRCRARADSNRSRPANFPCPEKTRANPRSFLPRAGAAARRSARQTTTSATAAAPFAQEAPASTRCSRSSSCPSVSPPRIRARSTRENPHRKDRGAAR